MRHFLLLFVLFSACSDSSDAPPSDTPRAEASNEAACPPADAFLTPTYPLRCGDDAAGVTCRYTALTCAPGEQPDIVCHCDATLGLLCEGHLRSCLPVVDGAGAITASGRPAPPHRGTATTCAAPGDAPRDATCTAQPWPGAPAQGCAANSDCASDEACLQTHHFGSATQCKCVTAECLDDSECAAGSVCTCGVNSAETHCGGPYNPTLCSNQCIPAQCKTDADCPGGWCSPSPNECNSGFTHWACHLPSDDGCLSNSECRLSSDGATCRQVDGAWRCASGPVCD